MSRWATLDSLRKKDEKKQGGQGRGEGGAPGHGDEEDEGQDFYVGGNTARGGGSGLSVLDPNNRGQDGDLVSGIFNRASTNQGPVPPAPSASDNQPTNARVVTMYRNGFTVDDGPFRAMDDPANQPFLRDLARGYVPRELEPPQGSQPRDQPMNLNLVDKRQEDYSPPPAPAYVAFSGEGNTMGPSNVNVGAVVKDGGDGGELPDCDPNKPSTQLQIILHDGKKIQRKFNLHHTIRHVQAFIRAEGAGGKPYRLLEGFPPKELTDFDRTLEAAGLKNARITQKLV